MWLEVGPRDQCETDWQATYAGHDRPRASLAGKRVLQELYWRDLSRLRALVRRIVRSPADAEDIAQDAFLRVWCAMEQGHIRSPSAVLFKTARNLALNHIRSKRSRAEPISDTDFASDAPTAEEQMIQEEDMQACRQVFDRLPLRCRETMALRVVDDLSYKEMSDRLGLSVSTLEKHFIRGRRMCRDMLLSGVEHRRAAATLRGRGQSAALAAE
jgi:RNA polymerase sigma-70 factor (ECF subfamily)